MKVLAPRILIVEDDQPRAIGIRQHLSREHPEWQMEFATQGQQAIEKLAMENFDAVLLDHDLPDMRGLDVMREIQARRFDVAVVFQVPLGNQQMVEEAADAGALDSVQKSELLDPQIGAALATAVQIQQVKRDFFRSNQEQVRTARQAALAQLSLTLRHEINNPLAALCAYTEMLLVEVKDNPKLRRRVQQIYDEAQRIREIMRKMETVRDRLKPYIGDQLMIDLTQPPGEPPPKSGT